ncbi:Rv3654c family TadE-like protein [Gordonia sp. NPDC003504]
MTAASRRGGLGAGVVADEDGYATVVAAGVILAVLTVLLMVVHVGASVVARHRAQSAADLAALAAAVDQVGAAADPCASAREVIADQRSGAQLRMCSVRGGDVVVEVVVPIELGVFGSREAGAAARAGPVG